MFVSDQMRVFTNFLLVISVILMSTWLCLMLNVTNQDKKDKIHKANAVSIQSEVWGPISPFYFFPNSVFSILIFANFFFFSILI